MEAPNIQTPDIKKDQTEIVSTTWNKYPSDTYTWLTDLLGNVERNEDIPEAIKLLMKEISNIDHFDIKLEVGYHGMICNITLQSWKKYTVYLGIYDDNYRQWYYNNKIVIDDVSYIFQTKDDWSLWLIADNILNDKDNNSKTNKEIISNIIKHYKPIKNFK